MLCLFEIHSSIFSEIFFATILNLALIELMALNTPISHNIKASNNTDNEAESSMRTSSEVGIQKVIHHDTHQHNNPAPKWNQFKKSKYVK